MPRAEAGSFSYVILSFVADPLRDLSVPIGIVLWSPESRYLGMRLVGEKEKIKGLDPQMDQPLVRLVHSQIQTWIETGKLPHALEPISPSDDRWWRHVRELLVHRVKLSEPRPIDCHEPDQELEVVYEAVVGPHRPVREHWMRIDGEITKCLKHLIADEEQHKFEQGREEGLVGIFKTRFLKRLEMTGVPVLTTRRCLPPWLNSPNNSAKNDRRPSLSSASAGRIWN